MLFLCPASVAKDGGARELAHGCAIERKGAQKQRFERKVLSSYKTLPKFYMYLYLDFTFMIYV